MDLSEITVYTQDGYRRYEDAKVGLLTHGLQPLFVVLHRARPLRFRAQAPRTGQRRRKLKRLRKIQRRKEHRVVS